MGEGVPDLKEVLTPGSIKAADASKAMQERTAKEAELKKACADFESIFIYSMLQKMRSAGPKSGLLKEMEGKSTYNSLIDQKVAEDLSRSGGFGLQQMLFDQIIATDKNFQKKN
ncbi:MAG: rod-binding protein [Syntrophales bacterium]